MIDTKTGFIITYFKNSPEAEIFLSNLIDTISRENYYLVLASHSKVPEKIQEKCDFYFYQDLNVVDDRKYSHGVAENNLIEISLLHLKYKNIKKTFKLCYDVIINDISIFEKWIKPGFNFVSCNWGEYKICTNSFYSDVNWLLDKIKFYHTVEDMFATNNVLEACWQNSIEKANSINEVYSFNDKYEFFGPNNKIDNLFYNYHDIDFLFSEEENKFYIRNNGEEINTDFAIFDFYTDICLVTEHNFNLKTGIFYWILPNFSGNLPKCKNGFYLEVYRNDIGMTIRKNILVKNYEMKDSLHKKFKEYKNAEPKFSEYCDFNNFEIYSQMGININDINTFIDIGASFGFASLPFIRKGIKVYMIEADPNVSKMLKNNYKCNGNIKVFDKAISDINGQIDFYHQKNNTIISSLFEKSANDTFDGRVKTTIESITLDKFMEDHVIEDLIDLTKIDIEGAEYSIFKSVKNETLIKFKRMIIEFHMNDNFQVMDIIEKLAENDFKYKLYKWGHDDDPKYIVGNKMGLIYAHK